MGELNSSWAGEFANIGWSPEKIKERLTTPFQRYEGQIIGAITTGDEKGKIIGVTQSKVENAKRLEKTLLGFTIGGDNLVSQREVIFPKNRIHGLLLILRKRFIICGKENHQIFFSKILKAAGSRSTVTASNYDIQKMGELEYSYSGDVYISKLTMNKQADLDFGYDEFTIAIVIGREKQNVIEETMRKIERIISL